ncbi:CLUMA_CG011760, isoform A [Clunio marinus]|uniref:CLUMA_CG011760, isoform A n=1 Tax=Clunio marinus TaxID=568069 RepID=A0A1J1IIX4_9DIPT|nr:CLUMA_CG011760, isoform A [Clunio marinus]
MNDEDLEPRFIGIVKEFDIFGAETIVTGGDNIKYITAEFNGEKLTISTTPEFALYEYEQTSQRLILVLQFTCRNGPSRTIFFNQIIKAVNNFKPEFSESNYEIMIPTPLPQGIDITMCLMGVEITAIDQDLYLNNLTFSLSETELFRVETVEEGRTYRAKLITTQQITRVDEDIEFSLTATDSFPDASSTVVGVKILSNPDIVTVAPVQFTSPIYLGNINNIQGNESLYVEAIAMNETSYDENVLFDILDDYSGTFAITNDGPNLSINITKALTIDILRKQSIFIIIRASRQADSKDFATILLDIESAEQRMPVFEENVYEGVLYETNLNLVLEDFILQRETYSDDVMYEISGEDADFFDIEVNEHIVKIFLKENVDLMEKEFLRFFVVASKDTIGSTSARAIIRTIPNVIMSPSFEKVLYKGSLIGETLLIETIKFTEEILSSEITLKLEGEDQDYFNVEIINNEVIITLNQTPVGKNLLSVVLSASTSEGSLDSKAFLSVVIEQELVAASSEGLLSASANIIIAVQHPSVSTISFEKSFYVGSIDNEKVLNLERILLLSSEIITSVELKGTDSSYFTPLLSENIVMISMQQDIPEDILLEKNVLIFTIAAATSANDSFVTANIIITLPRITDDKILRFENSVHIGYYNSISSIIEIDDIVLELNNYDEAVSFKVDRQDFELFDIEINSNVVSLKLKSDFNEESLRNKVFLTVYIIAERTGYASAETVVFIQLPVQCEEVELISFEKNIYRGAVNFNGVLNIENIHLLPDGDDQNIILSLKGDDAEKFSYERNEEVIQLKLDPLEVADRQHPFYFYIEAFKLGTIMTHTSILVDIIDKKLLEFDEPMYVGHINENLKLKLDSILLNDDLQSDGLTFILKDGDAEWFDVTKLGNEINITSNDNINDVNIRNKQFLWFYLEALGNEFYSATTLILINVPRWMSIPIEECYENLDPSQPVFEFGSYFFTIASDYIGNVDRVKAMMNESGTIQYSLNVQDDYLNQRIEINSDSGYLIVHSELPPNVYRFVIEARNIENQKFAEAKITLHVIESRECTEDLVTTVEKSLAIEMLEENEIYDTIMPAKIGDCTYRIMSVTPSQYMEIFTIDTETNFLKNVEPFDREAELFSGHSTPQIQIRMNLECDTSTNSALDAQIVTAFVNELSSDEIIYSRTVTYLNIIIVDQNDNKPVFTYPSEENYRIGFPTEELSEMLMVQHLMKVQSVDLDSGLNAVIRYSLESNDHFIINPQSGTIYPLKNCMNDIDIFELIVEATDLDGATGGNDESTTITITKVESDNLVLLSLENISIESIESFINELSDESGIDIRVINAFVSSKDEEKSEGRQFVTFTSKVAVIVYCFGNDLLLMKADDVIKSISSANVSNVFSLITYDESTYRMLDCSLTGLIIATSVLGGLLLLLIIATPLIWFFVLRNKTNYVARKTSELSFTNMNEDEEHGRTLPVVNVDDFRDVSKVTLKDAEILGIEIKGATNESSSDFVATEDSPNQSNDVESESKIDRKKSGVKFNELVERIEVITDDDINKSNNQ